MSGAAGTAEVSIVHGRPDGRDVAWIMAGVLLGYALGAIVFLGALALVQGRFPAGWKESTAFTAGAYLAQTAILTLPVALIGGRWRAIPWPALGFRLPERRWWWVGALGCLGLIVLAETVDRHLGNPLSEKLTSALAPEGFSWSGFVTMLLVAGVIAPFGEELVFRGVLYPWLRHRWGPAAGMAVSALLFGAVHLDPYWAAQAAVFGLFFAYLVERSGSIWPAYLAHVIINMTGVAMLYGTL